MSLIFLVLFPLAAALALLLVPQNSIRKIIVYASALAIAAASIYLLVTVGSAPAYFEIHAELVNNVMFYIEMGIALYILYISVKFRNYLTLLLIVLQSLLAIDYELAYAGSAVAERAMFVDQFSVIMALIIGVVGSLICVYSLGYMKDFHEHHKEVKDRRREFFFTMFAFIAAMFGLVFSNSLMWLYFFWEITTICSFLLIAYTQTHEARNNAFTALWMNLLGGLAFIGAIWYLGYSGQPIAELDKLIGSDKAIALLPAVLISFAGLTKAAQMPFSGWLLGAMIAPTPVSALLHSSTMVKAGVYVIIRLAPVLQDTFSGLMIALIGGFTFLLASAMAISQSNAKRVLAYSTVANLGLVVACGGLGTYEAVWAGILLIIFHAISKALLFLAVGTVEHRIQSRDIEDMGGLIIRMPKVAVMMLIGMAGMFLAPFGMLISKWATLRAFIDASPAISPILVAIIAFGSAVTIFFWTKWMGKIIAVTYLHKMVEDKVSGEEWIALTSLAALTVGICVLFGNVSSMLIEPYIMETYKGLGQSISILSQDSTMIMLIMMGMIFLLPLSMLYYRLPRRHLSPYMGGRTTTANMRFAGSAGMQRDLALRNYYLESYFGERRLFRPGVILCIGLIALMLAGVVTGVGI